MKKTVGGFHSIRYALSKLFKLGPFRLIKAMLKKNTCKTCALGMGGQKGGMTNELGRFPEFCKKSLQAMQSDMQGAIPKNFFKKTSIEQISKLSLRELEALGRLTRPLYSRAEDTHYTAISWDEALERVSGKMIETNPDKSFFYFSGRSSNEAGFLLQLMARVFGTNNVNNCSFYCHQATGVGLTDSIGSGTATVSLEDVEGCDLFVLIGGNPTSNHPRLMTNLAQLKKRGGKIIVVNPVVEPGLVKFKVPSIISSLFFGTKMADLYVTPHIGGDLALLSGLGKYIIETGAQDNDFIKQHTNSFSDFKTKIEDISWSYIYENSGVAKAEIEEMAELILKGRKVIFAWTMGITHHLNGADNVQGIVNLALLTGMIGRKHAGLLPLRGHSNVQGMGTVGVTPKLKQVTFQRLTDLGVTLPESTGLDTMACMEKAYKNEIDFAWCLGGNLYDSNPDSTFAARSLNNIGMITYLSTTFNRGHLFGRGKETLILPVLARDEEPQKTTQESMFSFVRISDGGPSRYKNLKSEVSIISKIATLVLKDEVIKWKEMANYQNIRDFISKTIPGLEKINSGEEFTIPNRLYNKPSFNTKDSKANFRVLNVPERKSGLTMMSVRSEGQFNSVVYEDEDAFRGIDRRDVILMNSLDMKKLDLVEDDLVQVKSKTGLVERVFIREFDIKQGNTLMYYPECNPLVSRAVDPRSKTPGFKSTQISIVRNSLSSNG
jgi:molybdopterin-dependent oxidoreductase alpha subunit